MTITEVRTQLKDAAVYWEEGFNGNHTHASTLTYIAKTLNKEQEENGIMVASLQPSERLILNNLIILANARAH
ncbi:MAG: hypothetical protein HFJ59_03645 [Clostridia bacterium]|nr:hypothetical protein [Clostridia bacterium]